MFIIYLVYVTPQFISVVSCRLDLGLNLVNTGNPFLHTNDVVYPKNFFLKKHLLAVKKPFQCAAVITIF